MEGPYLGGALYHYCPTGVSQFKNIARFGQTPEPGSIIFFTNGSRASHTGIVTEVTATKVKTIEGNTSRASGVIESGGGVCEKSYNLGHPRILRYGVPNWSAVVAATGWVKNSQKDRCRKTNVAWASNKWQLINHHRYLFGTDSYMLTDWQKWNGRVAEAEDPGDWYFLDETPGGPLEGACWHDRPGRIWSLGDLDGINGKGRQRTSSPSLS